MSSSPLESVCFLKLPKDFHSCGFALDANIPLPVQKKPEEDALQIENISQEQILSGLLCTLAYNKQNPHTQYYRDLVLKARPDMKMQLLNGAIVKTKNKDWDLAEEMFLCLEGLDPNDRAITLNMALFYDQKADDFEKKDESVAASCNSKALSLYLRCTREDEPQPCAYFNLGFFYLKQDMFSKAKECFSSYIDLATPLFESGKLSQKEKEKLNIEYKLQRAKQIISEIQKGDLEDKDFYLAHKLIKEGKEEEALQKLHKFLQKTPDCWNAWFMLGWALRKQKRYEDAKMSFQKALELGGEETPDCYNELAICLMETGELEAAKKCLFLALNLDGENTKIISNLGYCFLKEGNTSEAKKYFLTVLEFDKEDKIALLELAKLEALEA